MSMLFDPYPLRQLILRNRIVVSPMCQYSATDGKANDWHLVHLGSRAAGGAGLVFTEAVAVAPEGRITPEDLGLWDDGQIEPLRRITKFILSQGAAPAIQLAHAGRKAGAWRPWLNNAGSIPLSCGGWNPVGPSGVAFDQHYLTPREMTTVEIQNVILAFVEAARRSWDAGFKVVEVHAAHGYLLHQFLSPASNQRSDQYGGSFDNRIRLTMQVCQAIRDFWPKNMPVLVRLSATDWVENGWTIQDSVELSRRLKAVDIDLIDVSSGGTSATAAIPTGPGYQTAFAAQIRNEARIAVGTVGMITEATQAEHILRTEQADLIFLARQLLRDPYWPLHADEALGGKLATWPAQYHRATHRDQPLNAPAIAEPFSASSL